MDSKVPKWAPYFKVEWARDFVNRDIPKQLDLVEDMMSNQSTNVFAGLGKLGKSFLMMQLGICFDFAMPFLGHTIPERKSTLIIQMEIGEKRFQQRLRTMLDYIGREPEKLSVVNCRNFKLHTKEERAYFLNLMVNEVVPWYEPEIVIFDPISKLHFYNENSSQEMAYFLSIFDDLLTKDGVEAVVYVHHETKNQFQPGQTLDAHKMRGSTVLFDFADSATTLKYTKQRGIFRLIHEDRDHEKFETFISRDPFTFWYDLAATKGEIPPVKVREAVETLGNKVMQKDLIKELQARFDCKKYTATKAIKEAVGLKVIYERRDKKVKGRPAFYCSI